MRVSPSWLIAVALLFAVAACGGREVSPPSSDTTTATTAVPSDDDVETLADFTGSDEAEWRDRAIRVEEATRECMAELGFDYIPVIPPDDPVVVGDEEERIRTQGFGISTLFGAEEQTDDWVDPNEERVQALSETERTAWYEALNGTEEEWAEVLVERIDEETGQTWQELGGTGRPGCSGRASEAEWGTTASNALHEELSPAIDEMYERVRADPRIVEATEEWSACMASRGFVFESRQHMYDVGWPDLERRLEEIVDAGGRVDPFEGWTQEEVDAFHEESSQQEIDALYAEAHRTNTGNVDPDALATLQQYEIDMAVADWECGEGHGELYLEVSREFEADFIAENRTVLEQIRNVQRGDG